MVLDKDPQLLDRVSDVAKPFLETLQYSTKAIVLDQKEKFFFRLAVVIETREADVGCTRDVAHRGRVIVLIGKDLRRGAKNEFELLVVTCEICGGLTHLLFTSGFDV